MAGQVLAGCGGASGSNRRSVQCRSWLSLQGVRRICGCGQGGDERLDVQGFRLGQKRRGHNFYGNLTSLPTLTRSAVNGNLQRRAAHPLRR